MLNKISGDLYRYSGYMLHSSLLLMSIFYQSALILHTWDGGVWFKWVRYYWCGNCFSCNQSIKRIKIEKGG